MSYRATWRAALASLVALAALTAVLALDLPSWLAARRGSGKLVVFCAAGIKGPIAALAERYRREMGVDVQLQYGGSQHLLASLKLAPQADLFIPAEEEHVALARRKGLVAEVLPLASMRPVLAVAKGNPKNYSGLDGLLRQGGRISHASSELTAVGKLSRDALRASGQWAEYEKLITVEKPTVNDVALDVQVGAADAAIVWDITVRMMEGIEEAPAPALAGRQARIQACVTTSCTQPAEALWFARYLASCDVGGPAFAEEGFTPAGGDPWGDGSIPHLHVRAGAMLRPALEGVITAFEAREGVRVTRSYNGCGILVGEIKEGAVTDAFISCDPDFLDEVSARFDPGVTISRNQLVILVHKGNPHGIRGLRDLGKPGLRIGVGNEKQCAMGRRTGQALDIDRSRDPIRKNVVVEAASGDMLVNQMLAAPSSLDAVVAYITNAAGHADKLEAVPISIKCAFPDQPFAAARGTKHRQLVGRLLDAIRSEEARQRFLDVGFSLPE
jgi:molybdenum ABC transporter molybdate-binding protein